MVHLPAALPRFAAIAVGLLLATAAATFAADRAITPPAVPTADSTAPAEPETLVVPDVRKQVYVFAKGALEDAGFAWKVVGGVEGYAANVVAQQSPAPGTRLVDTGAPLVTLTLASNPSYARAGEPANASPYAGTKLVLADLAVEPLPAEKAPAPAAAPPPPAAKTKPAAKKPAKRQAAKQKPAGKKKPAAKKPAKKQAAARPSKRPPAFAVPGAPVEPLDEMPLDERARRLAAWVEAHPRPTNRNVKHWLFQHEWIVTGARFGWWRGREALELLVRIDRRVEARWGVGSKSRFVAEGALAEVKRKSR